MPVRRSAAVIALVATLLLAPTSARAAAPEVYAITGARLVPVAAKPVARGTIVLRDGLIEAAGEKVAVPPDATVIDGTGLTVYPGLIDAMTRLGMPEAREYPPARGDSYRLPTVRAEVAATTLMRPDRAAIDARRRAGFGAALTAPYVGLFPGQSALLVLGDSADVGALVLKSPVAVHLDLSAAEAERGYPASLMGKVAAARQALYDAQDAARRLAAYERDPKGKPRPSSARALLALRSVVEKRQPLVIHADSQGDIERALRLSREFGLRPIIQGGAESYRVASELKAANAAVFLSADLPEPPRVAAGDEDTSTLQALRRRALAPRSAAALRKAGVPFALATDGLQRPGDFARNVRKMIAAGLSEDDAVAAATLAAARLLGVERQLGSLEAGKIANVVVADGPLFGPKTRIRHLFVDGKKVDLEAPPARQTAASEPGRSATERGPADPAPAAQTPDRRAPRPESTRPPSPLPEARVGDNPSTNTDTTDAARRLPTRTPTDPSPAKPAAAPPPVTEGPVPPPPAPLPATFVLRGATVWTVGPQGVLRNADVLVKGGKIAAVGAGLKVPAGTREIEARGKHVTPGMIDCHSHTAIEGGVNEGTNSVTAEVRVADVINADDVNIYRQLAGGTTAANLLHGSANAIGGQNAVVKWRWGGRPDGLLFKQAPPGIKFALGENPKRSNSYGFSTAPPRYPASRMGVERTIRDKFLQARDYAAKWKAYRAGKAPLPPRRDLQLDALVEVLEGKRLVHCHSYRQDEILMMMRLAEEFGFRIATFQHVLEGYKVADELAAHGAGGSTFSDWWAYKVEAWDAIPHNAALMTARGVVASFNSDSSELARRMNLEAAKAVRWGGLTPEQAIQLVTLNPAKQLGVDKYVGSLEAGKDADLVVWSGDPLSTATICEKTFVDGRLLFDREADLALRPKLEAEKKALAAGEKSALTPVPFPNAGRGVPKAGSTSALRKAEVVPVAGPPLPEVGKGPTELGKGTAAITDGSVTAIVGGMVHPVAGPAVPNGVVLVRGDKIFAVGAASKVPVPAGAARVDAQGLHVYPGLIDADTTLGLTEIGSVRATNDAREIGEFNPELRVAIAVNPDSELIPVARAGGVLHAATAPTGGTLCGMGALLRLDGWTWEDLAVQKTVGLYVNFPFLGTPRFRETGHLCEEGSGDGHEDDPAFRSGAFVPAGSRDARALLLGDHPETAEGPAPDPPTPAPANPTPGSPPAASDAPPRRDPQTILRPLNTFLEDARRYQKARKVGAGGSTPFERDPKFEAMLPILDGSAPLFVRADREREIREAVAWAKKERLSLVLVGGSEADKAADLLAKEKVPVILGPVLSLPARFDTPYDDAYTLPARLAKAGVRFCLSTGDASNVRRLPHHAAMARAFGLTRDEALKAITLYPAQILGMGDRLGTLEPGKEANLLLTTGDPLEIVTEIKAAYIAGKPVDLSNKHQRLYDKYRARPKK